MKHRRIGREPVEQRTCFLCGKRMPNELMGMREHLLWEHEKEEVVDKLGLTEYDYEKLLEGFHATPGYN